MGPRRSAQVGVRANIVGWVGRGRARVANGYIVDVCCSQRVSSREICVQHACVISSAKSQVCYLVSSRHLPCTSTTTHPPPPLPTPAPSILPTPRHPAARQPAHLQHRARPGPQWAAPQGARRHAAVQQLIRLLLLFLLQQQQEPCRRAAGAERPARHWLLQELRDRLDEQSKGRGKSCITGIERLLRLGAHERPGSQGDTGTGKIETIGVVPA